MAKKRRGKHGTPHRSATRRPGPAGPAGGGLQDLPPEAVELMATIRRCLRSGNPLDFVALICAMIEVFEDAPDDEELREIVQDMDDPGGPDEAARRVNAPGRVHAPSLFDAPTLFDDAGLFEGPLGGGDGPGPVPFSLSGMVESLIHTDIAETTAALTVLAALVDEDLVAARARREVATRRQPVPLDFAMMGSIRIDEAWIMTDDLGDGDNVILGYTWPGGRRQTAVVYIDHNLGGGPAGVVKDALLVDDPLELILDTYGQVAREDGFTEHLSPLPGADARAIVETALAAGQDVALPEPPPDDDEASMWPECRPFVRFLAGRLPDGGSAEAHSACRPVPLNDVVAAFWESPEAEAAAITAGTAAGDAAELLFAAAEAAAGHPLRWSPTSLEVLLIDELPWSASAPEEVLAAIPEVITSVVRHAHRVLGIPGQPRAETLAALGGMLPEYAELCDLPGLRELRRSNAELAALRQGDARPYLRRQLRGYVGSDAALDALDADPLPAEEFDLDGVPADIRPRVGEVAGHVDRFLAAHGEVGFDREFCTAARRFLAATIDADPALWRRAARTDTAAAAIVWAVGRANDLVARPGAPVSVKDLQTFFGLSSSPAQRGQTMLRALGIDPYRLRFQVGLGDARYLTGATRAKLMAQRDELG